MTSDDAVMQIMRRHEGTWRGRYRHIDIDGVMLDEHETSVECVFPESGPYAYVQRNRFSWADGREEAMEFGGVLRDGMLHWDTEIFSGYAWVTHEDAILLKLDRKDEPGVSFKEIILLEDGADHRCRTWHWFRDGAPFQRTLCDEYRVRA